MRGSHHIENAAPNAAFFRLYVPATLAKLRPSHHVVKALRFSEGPLKKEALPPIIFKHKLLPRDAIHSSPGLTNSGAAAKVREHQGRLIKIATFREQQP